MSLIMNGSAISVALGLDPNPDNNPITISVTDSSITTAGYAGFSITIFVMLPSFTAEYLPAIFNAPVLNLTLGILSGAPSASATFHQPFLLGLTLGMLPGNVITYHPGEFYMPAPLGLTLGILPGAPLASSSVTMPAPLGLTLGILQLANLLVTKTMATLRDMPFYWPVWLVDITLSGGGPTLHFSTTNILIGTVQYECYIAEIKGAADSINRQTSDVQNSDISITFRNLAYAAYAYLIQLGVDFPVQWEASVVTIQETAFDLNGNMAAPVLMFKGVLDEPTDISLTQFSCKVSSMPFLMDKRWLQPLVDTGSFPNAWEDVGNALAVVYGSNVLLPSQRVDWGAKTTLATDLSVSSSSLTLSDGSRFPSSGQLMVDSEIITYTGRSGDTCTGLTKGASGTAAAAHNAGAEVWQVKTSYDSVIACHPLAAVTTVFAEFQGKFWRVSSGVTTFTQAVGGRTMQFIRAAQAVKVDAVIDTIGVNDTITVSQGSHAHGALSTTSIAATSATGSATCHSAGWAPNNIFDGKDTTFCFVDNTQSNCSTIDHLNWSLTAYFPMYTGSAPSAVRAVITHNSSIQGVSGSSITLAGNSVQLGAKVTEKFDLGTAVPGSLTLSGVCGSGTPYALVESWVYEISLEVDADTTADSAALGVVKSGGASKVGQAVSTHTIERFHALVNGYQDDASGTYTGTPNAVIEQPDEVMKHFLCVASGQYTPADMDPVSFGAAATAYASLGYKAAFALVTQLTSPLNFLHQLAYEHRCTLIYLAGLWRLNVIPDSAPSSIRTITGGELAGEGAQFSFSRTPWIGIFNQFTANYSEDYSRVLANSDWLGSIMAQDSDSQATFGTFPQTLNLATIRDTATAQSVLAHMLIEMERPRMIVTFTVNWRNFDLNVGDTISVDSPLWSGMQFYIEGIERTDMGMAKVTARSWWSTGGFGGPPGP